MTTSRGNLNIGTPFGRNGLFSRFASRVLALGLLISITQFARFGVPPKIQKQRTVFRSL
jgi:hypothetical protein